MPAMRLEVGQVIGQFRLEEHVHTGGMASLWRVSSAAERQALLMKIPLLRYGEDPAAIVSFEVEQMLLPRLSGPHVPRFVATGDLDLPYIVMELIAGRSLEARLPELPLPCEEVVGLGAKLATALHEVHRQRVIHLDVKPSNVMVRESGEAVLIDFGLSRHEELPDLMAEEFHVPIGTGPYISPEQLLRNRSDPRSDLFSLGVLMYFFATGERPFGDPVRVRDWRRRLYRDPVPPRALRPDLPPWLQEVILRCLEVDAGQRHASAAQLAFELRNPAAVELTSRATRLRRDAALAVARRWYRTSRARASTPQTSSDRLARAPIVMAAVDLAVGMEPLADALRVAVRRILQTEPGARLACVNVLKLGRIALDEFEDAQGRNRHLQLLAALKLWAHPLQVPTTPVTCHVLESTDPAGAIVEFARNNHVDQIVLGARGASGLRRYLGSVSSRVVAEAPCTVTVVRTPVPASAAPGIPPRPLLDDTAPGTS
jgi:nucleotide-binding universal stress UspA family protein